MNSKVLRLAQDLRHELVNNILPFWMSGTVDNINGGFLGQVTFSGEQVREAVKGAVLNTRILWTFAAAYRVLGDKEYLVMGERAYNYLLDHFADKRYGGIYWSVDHKGNPSDTKKQLYAIGFAIYGFSEYYRATGNKHSLDMAIELFRSIEKNAYDPVYGGYYEAFTRDWKPLDDMRLSDKDSNECKTMNTHLHIIEPYTNLYRVWKDASLEKRIRELISVFTDKILVKETGHLGLFFDERWNPKSDIISYGHDIEASWLLHESALVLGDGRLLNSIEPLVVRIADAAAEGLQPDGSLIYEYDKASGHVDRDRHWWPQAEAVVGYFNIFQYFNDGGALEKAVRAWEYTDANMIDKSGGEWFWSIKADGSVNSGGDKAGFWKCPYHNSRMCLEIIERVTK